MIIFPLPRLVAGAWWGELHASRNWLCLSDNNKSCHLLSLYCVLSVEASYLCYRYLVFQPGLEQQEHSQYSLHGCAYSRRGILGWDWVLCILCPHVGKQVQGAVGSRRRRGADSRAWMTHTFNPQVVPGPRICLSTYGTYYPSTGLHIGDRSNKYGLSFRGDFSLDVLLVVLLFCCDPCWEGLEWERGSCGCILVTQCDVTALVMTTL